MLRGMIDPKNTVNKTLEAERITGIRGGTAASAQQGVAQAYYNTGGIAAFLARAVLWCWHKIKKPRAG